MFRLIAMAAVGVLVLGASADDKKEPTRSLAEDAAYLAEHSGKQGWMSTEVAVKMGKNEGKGQLVVGFTADKGKPTGNVTYGIKFGDSEIKAAMKSSDAFELVEKDGKRVIEVYRTKSEFKDGKLVTEREKEPRMTLEYSIKGGELTVKPTAKGGVVSGWVGHEVNLGEGVTFKPRK